MRTSEHRLFRDRTDAGRRLGERLAGRSFRSPLVLGIPRGGVVTGAAVAAVIGAELDVVLARKLRAQHQPEYALGAVSEDGHVTLNPFAGDHASDAYLAVETKYQLDEIARRRAIFRAVRPAARIAGRSVIVTDDGLATGSTMIAALQAVRVKGPFELIAAVPIGSPDRIGQVSEYCDEFVSLLAPDDFYAVGQFYEDFEAVEDEEVVESLRHTHPAAKQNERP